MIKGVRFTILVLGVICWGIVFSKNNNSKQNIIFIKDTIKQKNEYLERSIDTKTDSNYDCTNKININRSDSIELISLPGIGPVTASRIIRYRTEIGLFKNDSDIINVKGIGKAKLSKIKDLICF